MNNIKKLYKLIILSITLFIITPKVFALSVSEANVTIPAGGGKSIELSTTSDKPLTSIEFTLVYTTYDIPANFIVNNNYTDSFPNGIKHKVNFTNALSGKIVLGTVDIRVVNNPKDTVGTINIHSAKGYTESGEVITLDNQNINVKIGEDTKPTIVTNQHEEFDKNALKEIKSEKVKITLKKDTFDYTVTIPKDLEELDLTPVATNDNYKIEVSNQKINELTDNTITITVSDNQGNSSTYNIKVNKLKDIEKVEIDKSDNLPKNTYTSKWLIAIIFFGVIFFFGLILIKKGK